MVDLEGLKAKALAATPGPWWIDSHGHTMISEDNLEVIFYNDNSARPAVRHDSTGNLSHWRNDCDASYIAAANPAVTLELIERLQQAETERDALRAELEAARKQEPAVLIEGKKIFWNPEYKGVHEGGFYASPIPAKISKGVAQVLIHAAISENPELLELFYSPVPAQQAAEVTQDIVESAHEVTRALTALRHTRDAFEIGGLIRSDINSICDALDVTASKLFQMAKGGENER